MATQYGLKTGTKNPDRNQKVPQGNARDVRVGERKLRKQGFENLTTQDRIEKIGLSQADKVHLLLRNCHCQSPV